MGWRAKSKLIVAGAAIAIAASSGALRGAIVAYGQGTGPSDFPQDPITPEVLNRIGKLSEVNIEAVDHIILRISTFFRPDAPNAPVGIQSRVHRWEHEIKIWVSVNPNDDREKALRREIAQLRDFSIREGGAGFPGIRFTQSPDDAQMWIVGRPDFQDPAFVKTIVATFLMDDANQGSSLFSLAAKNGCAHHLNIGSVPGTPLDQSIIQAVTLISTNSDPADQIACLHRGFAAAMGFINDAEDPLETKARSWTQPSAELSVPTDVDGLLLRLLYSRRLSSGMGGLAAAKIMVDDAVRFYEKLEISP